MKNYLYLSLLPEALIASNLSPEEFGAISQRAYLGQLRPGNIFEIDPNFKSDYLPVAKLDELCKPHPDGRPHKSVYLSVYRVLEHIPMSAFRNLYLVTSDGKTFELSKSEFVPDPKQHLYMYQDFAPCRPRVASILNPKEYVARLTSSERLVNLPKLAFATWISVRWNPILKMEILAACHIRTSTTCATAL
ncbi:MAG: hypothetical protein ACLUKN_09205 [Bacilli bacterium]